MEKNIAVIKGDGIGPEIVNEAIKVLDAIAKKYNHTFNYKNILMGGCSIDAYGVPLTDEALEVAKNSDAVLLGSIGGDTNTSPWYKLDPTLRPEAGLLKIRKELGLTLEKFGESLGVSKGAISAIEVGTRNLTEQMAKAICREYNVNYDYLVNGEGEMFDNLPQTVLDELCMQYNLDEFDRKLINLYLSLPESARTAIKEQIKKEFISKE